AVSECWPCPSALLPDLQGTVTRDRQQGSPAKLPGVGRDFSIRQVNAATRSDYSDRRQPERTIRVGWNWPRAWRERGDPVGVLRVERRVLPRSTGQLSAFRHQPWPGAAHQPQRDHSLEFQSRLRWRQHVGSRSGRKTPLAVCSGPLSCLEGVSVRLSGGAGGNRGTAKG